jgi:hypothetical protein
MTDHELDQLIDGALASYAPEPDPRLAKRVLARMRRPWRWMLIPAAAAVAAGMVAYFSASGSSVIAPAQVAPVTAASSPVADPPPLRLRKKPIRRTVETAIPLSAQERRLEQVFQAHPEIASQLQAETSAEPLNIPELESKPLTIEPLETIAPNIDD